MVDKITSGKAVLFLGAGAAFGAIAPAGKAVVSGNQLRDLLSDRFLGGEQKDKSLVQVANYSKHQAGLNEVQVFIKGQFELLQPADFHKLLPLFKWHAIFTTNYDLIVERAYDQVPKRLQNLAPIVRDGDQFSEAISNPDQLPYFKLHGCISSINDSNLPLILASEEYAKYKNNRRRLFKHLLEFGREHPIIFCGYQIGDPNIQQILFDLCDSGIERPNYMVVDPGLNKFDRTMWQANRFDTLSWTFKNFLEHLDKEIDTNKRILGSITKASNKPYNKYLKHTAVFSQQLLNYLDTELEFIYQGMPFEGTQPIDFYTGLDDGWGAIHQDLDVTRKICDQLLIDSLVDEKLKGSSSFLVKGHAGSGKSVLLKRIAWNAVKELDDYPVFFLRKGAILRPSLVSELCHGLDKRALLVVDDALANRTDLLKLYELLNYEDAPVSIITSSRSNEWNQLGGDLESHILAEYDLDKLSEREINQLVEKLNKHHCLGNLKNLKLSDVKSNFNLTSDRQLLVALHEVTSGKPFEQIIYDEYQRITPIEAKLLYMDVCTLHRLNVPVRAGLISRISGISIEDFRKRFLSPLQHLIKTYMDQRSRDYVYVARHPLIAEFVFDQALSDPNAKAEQLVRVISRMNIDYTVDEEAFSILIKGKILAKLFSDKYLAKKIYDAAEEAGAPMHYIWHQRAIFEINHPGADLNAAMSAILNAEKNLVNGRSDKAVLHTKALIYKKMAKASSYPLEVNKYRVEARLILERLLKSNNDSRAFHALAELDLDELDEKLHSVPMNGIALDDLHERALISIVKKAEDIIYKGLQRYPGDEYLLISKANLARKLNEHENVRTILENAYRNNSSSEYLAISLARNKGESGDLAGSTQILRTAIAQTPNSKPLYLALAKNLILENDQSITPEIIHHLKRSFSPGDTNYDAQFWYGRHNYLYGNRKEAEEIFRKLKSTNLPPNLRRRLQGNSLDSSGMEIVYSGEVVSEHVDFFFIRSTELGDKVFSHISNFYDKSTEDITIGTEVSFNLSFSMRGPCAINVKKRS